MTAAIGHEWWRKVMAGPDGVLETKDVGQQVSSADEAEGYVVLPRPGEPRVVVHQRNQVAVRDALERMVSSRTSNGVVRRLAQRVSPLALSKKPDWMVHTDSKDGTLRQCLSRVLNAEVDIAVSIGPPRVNRKPVVRCYSGDEMIAVAKVGADPHTLLMTQNEAQWLTALQASPIDGVRTPELIYSGSYGDSSLIVMEPLDLVDDFGMPLHQMPLDAISAFADTYLVPGATLRGSKWWNDLQVRLGVMSTPLKPVLEAVVADSLFDEIALSAWHGDFSPWNLGYARNGELAIWDWERASVGVPVGFDLLHLHYQYGAGFDAATIVLGEFGVPVAQHSLIQRLYLLELCARNVEAVATNTEKHHQVVRDLDQLGW